MSDRQLVSTGVKQRVDGFKDRIPEYDPRSGNHLWVVLQSYQIDPKKWTESDELVIFDIENLLSVEGPGCYYCEQPYSPSLYYRRCPGEPRE